MDFMNYEIRGQKVHVRLIVSLINEGKRNKHILESLALVGLRLMSDSICT